MSSDTERLTSFCSALDEVHERVRSEVGAQDVAHVKRLNRFSRAMEVVGRVAIHISVEPVLFGAGVGALWVHKQLQATEIGHPVLHGCYDGLEGAESFQSKTWKWDIPIDEEAWHRGHNLRHHPYTNIAGKDPDIHFGPVRLNRHTPHRWFHTVQLPYTFLVLWPAFAIGMNSHFTGLLDITKAERDFLPDRSVASVLGAVKMAFRKFIPYYAKEYVFFPMLAGPFWWKVVLGNWMAERGRDVYTAASIFCGHIGPDLDGHPAGTRARGRGAWYAMQVEQAQNFKVPHMWSVLCGGLDYQIEHHLFPKLPPDRLRQIAPDVQRICEEHSVKYRTGSWGRVLGGALRQVWRLSFPDPAPAVSHA